ncbi:MAG: tRNA (adenosine(37)-N6)-dimethylallyltransferase MiaA [Balneolaceae bacterium]
MKQRIVIAGPTASGKSSLAVSLAEKTGGEIISVDSRQCYRQINIGTAKPTPAQQARVPHHNVSILDLDQPDTVAAFKVRAEKYALEIEERGKTVIYCGGSSLHLQSIFHPLDDIPGANQKNVDQLTRQIEEEGLKSVYKKLLKADPEYAKKMDGMNPHRMIRALDVWMQTGKPFSEFHSGKAPKLPEHISLFALHHPRKILHQRISDRTDRMIADGLVEETESLLKKGYSPNLQALQTVGYRQAIQHLRGEISRQDMVADIKTATRRYAKRQITWLRRWNFVEWLDLSPADDANTGQELIEHIEQQVAADIQKG